MSDAELVAGCLDGRVDAWAEVVRRHERLVRAIARSYGLSSHDADEVAQITFGILAQSLPRLRPDTRLAPWLSTVARRHTWRLLETRRREQPAELDDHVLSHDPVHDEADRRADAEAVRAALRVLSPRCRALLELLYLRGETAYAEVAEQLDIPIGSIGPTRGRCLARLRALLDPADQGAGGWQR